MLTEKRRGPKPTGKGTLVGVRLQPDILAALDDFAASEKDRSRPEAVRRILRDWLIGHGYIASPENPDSAESRDS